MAVDPTSAPGPFDHRTATAEAAAWLVRRERGLRPDEEAGLTHWLARDSRHVALLAQHEATLRHVQRLAAIHPASNSTLRNKDLFAPPRRQRTHAVRRWSWSLALAAAAAVVIAAGVTWWQPPTDSPAVAIASRSYLQANERRVLADGSTVELRAGSLIEVHYSATERRVRLVAGQAHFDVAKNPSRPFIVETRGVAVRAVGTAFGVALEAERVEVVVTEGRVQLGSSVPSGAAASSSTSSSFSTSTPSSTATATATATATLTSTSNGATAPSVESSTFVAGSTPILTAGARAFISLTRVADEAPAIEMLNADALSAATAWKKPWLHFEETPLAEAVAEFNRHNARQLVLRDTALGTHPIGGSFRVDNVDSFVRLLELTVGVEVAERGTDRIVLRRAP